MSGLLLCSNLQTSGNDVLTDKQSRVWFPTSPTPLEVRHKVPGTAEAPGEHSMLLTPVVWGFPAPEPTSVGSSALVDFSFQEFAQLPFHPKQFSYIFPPPLHLRPPFPQVNPKLLQEMSSCPEMSLHIVTQDAQLQELKRPFPAHLPSPHHTGFYYSPSCLPQSSLPPDGREPVYVIVPSMETASYL